MKAEEKKLIKRCIAGDPPSWELFVTTFTPVIKSSVYTVLNRYSCNLQEEDIADLCQETLLSLMEKECHKLKKYEGTNNCSFSTWLFVVVSRSTINFLKKKGRKDDPCSSIGERIFPGESGDFTQEISKQQLLSKLKEVIQTRLNPREQLFMRLFWEQETPEGKIAEMLDLTPNATYVLKNRTIKKIKKYLCNTYEFELSNQVQGKTNDKPMG